MRQHPEETSPRPTDQSLMLSASRRRTCRTLAVFSQVNVLVLTTSLIYVSLSERPTPPEMVVLATNCPLFLHHLNGP